MVTKWGMSERLGPVSYKLSDEDPFLGREIHQQRQFSEHTLEIIDDEVARILHDASDRAIAILSENRDKLDVLARALVEREEIGEKDIVELIGPSVHHREDEIKAFSKQRRFGAQDSVVGSMAVGEAMGSKKKKIRAEFRKNREVRVRQRDLTRDYQEHGFEADESARSERVSGKGALSRKRTIMVNDVDDHGARRARSCRDVDESACLRGTVLSVGGLQNPVQSARRQVHRVPRAAA